MIKELIKWKPLIIGIILVTTIYIVSDTISGQNMLLLSFILAGIAVGFMVGSDVKNGVLENRRFSEHQKQVFGAVNGALLGLIGGLIVSAILIGMMYFQGYGEYVSSIISTIILYIGLEIVMGVIGGVFGSFIKSESSKT